MERIETRPTFAEATATERGSEPVSIKKQNASYRMVISFAGNRIGAIARTKVGDRCRREFARHGG